MAEFYQSLATEGQASPLPAVFPLLLYTGDPKWSAARSTGELIRPEIPETFDELMAILSDEAPEQFAVFGRWMSNYLAGTPAETEVTEPIRSAREVRSMFATKLKEYGEQLKEEAHKEGRLQGRQEGRQEGRRETARAMKERGIDGTVIAEVTGLSAQEIDAL